MTELGLTLSSQHQEGCESLAGPGGSGGHWRVTPQPPIGRVCQSPSQPVLCEGHTQLVAMPACVVLVESCRG